MSEPEKNALPPIPTKRYFTIGEVAELCDVKTSTLRHWEREFAELQPMKRANNRRYYQHHEVLLIRKIRSLTLEGYTLNGVRNYLSNKKDFDNNAAVRLSSDELKQIRSDLRSVLTIFNGVLNEPIHE